MSAAPAAALTLREKCIKYRVVVCGVSGQIGAGKTTLCESLVKLYGEEMVLVRNFGDRLKEEIAFHANDDVKQFYTHEGKNTVMPLYGMTRGTMLQKWGDAIRGVHPMAWVFAVHAWVEQQIDERVERGILREQVPNSGNKACNLLVLIGDVRMPNELQWIEEKCAGITIRLTGDPGAVRANSTRNLTHISETALDDCPKFAAHIDTNHSGVVSTCNAAVAVILAHCVRMFYICESKN